MIQMPLLKCSRGQLHKKGGAIGQSVKHLILGLLLFSLWTTPSHARGFIRDAEIEATLQLIAQPILVAAGLRPGSVRIVIVNDPSVNAFVNGRDAIFINTGMLTRLKTVPMIQSVIAHEVGHITAGHIVTRNAASRNAQSAIGIGMLLAAIAAGNGGRGAAAALAASSAQVANRQLLAHTRAEEASADQAAVRYMSRAGIDPQGALDALELFRGQEILSENRRDPYATTHPLSSQRISFLRDTVARNKTGTKPTSSQTNYWHARMVAKFEGFLRNPKTILTRAKSTKDVELSTYLKAIAYHRSSRSKDAHAHIDALLRARPDDPFYNELKGQFFLESGQVNAAIPYYQKAVSLRPKDTLLQSGLARSLLALDTTNGTKQALPILEKAARLDRLNPRILQDLALAYAKLGRPGNASLATAERFALLGRIKDAKLHAERAMRALPEGTPAWRQAQDIVVVAKRAGI